MSILTKTEAKPQMTKSIKLLPERAMNGAIPPLENGDRLSRAEFERRYQAHPEIKKAELIEGVVYGIEIYLYFERAAQHHEPHFHATYGEYDASFAIDPPLLLAGRLPRRQRRLVLAWAELHQAELTENWQRAIAGRVLLRIEGLR